MYRFFSVVGFSGIEEGMLEFGGLVRFLKWCLSRVFRESKSYWVSDLSNEGKEWDGGGGGIGVLGRGIGYGGRW